MGGEKKIARRAYYPSSSRVMGILMPLGVPEEKRVMSGTFSASNTTAMLG